MGICENCKSLDTCAVAMPCTEKCFFFVPTEDYRIKNSKEYAIGYEQGRSDRDKELSELPNEYADKLWKIAYERGRANERAKAEDIINRLDVDTEDLVNAHELLDTLRGMLI